jgi:hypothetical protein
MAMSTLRRLTTALLALGFAVLPPVAAAPAAAEPTPTPGPACKAGSLKLTFPGDTAVADAPDTWVARTGRIQETAGDSYSDLFLTVDLWPDQGSPGSTPKARFTGTKATVVMPMLRRVNSPRPGWEAVRLKPPIVWPNSVTSSFKFELSFPSNAAVTTYSAKWTATATRCGDTVLGSGTGMRFGFMTAGTSMSPSAKPHTSPSAAKPSRKPSASAAPLPSEEEVVVSPDESSPEESSAAQPDSDLASGEPDSSTPLPWLAGLGVTALLVAVGLIFWLRRTSYEDED